MPESEWPDSRPPGDPTGQIFVEADDTDPHTGELESDSVPHPSVLRTATVVSGRIVLGIVIVALVGVVVAAASLIPLPGVHARAVSSVVTPVPTEQQLVCPGGLLRLASSSGAAATKPSAIGTPQITAAAIPGSASTTAFTSSDAGTAKSASAPQLLSTPAVAAGAQAATLGGAQSESVSASEFAGLASAACVSPVGGSWLVGGATSVGRSTLLLLSNPTAVASTASVHIYGETGQITAPGMDGIVVAAGGQRVLSIAGFAPNLASPVVHVVSTGGQLVANLEQSTVRGLVPGGIDFVGGQAQPTKDAVIPGVVVSGTDAINGLIGKSGYEDLQSTLRVFVPGTKNTSVTITVLDENGTVTGKPKTAQVVAGTVSDVALDSLSDGSYTVLVSADIPVVTSVRVSTAGSSAVNSATDFAWTTAAPLLTSSTIVAVAGNMSAALHLENPTAARESVTVHPLAGADITTMVGPHSASTVPVAAGSTYVLQGFSEIYASVSGTTDGGVTSYVISPTSRGASPLRVYR